MKAIYLTFCFLAMFCTPSAASQDKDLTNLFESASRSVGVPYDVIVAIAKVESGFNPWALNIEGRSYHFDTKAGAIAKANEALKAGRSFDIGLMQINNWWLKRYDLTLSDAFNPQTNIYFGSQILKQEIERHGNLWAAVGAYHSPKTARASAYSRKVKAVWENGSQIKVTYNQQAARKNDRFPIAQKKRQQYLDFGSPMLVSSKSAVLASDHNMRTTTTAVTNSMKVRLSK